jgi:hypothetical protein
MSIVTADSPTVIGGVDTHQDLHVAAVVNSEGIELGSQSF